MQKSYSPGFIDGYNDSDYNYLQCNDIANYYKDYHDGLHKRKIHCSILEIDTVSFEDFESNNIQVVSIVSNWRYE